MASFVSPHPFRCLVHFGGDRDWDEFRCEELAALLLMFGQDPALCFVPKTTNLHDPFLECWLPDLSIASKICERAVLIKNIYHVWVDGSSVDKLVESLENPSSSSSSSSGTAPDLSWQSICTNKTKSFRFDIAAHGFSMPTSEKQSYRDLLMPVLGCSGPVKIKDPDMRVVLILFNPKCDGENMITWCYLGMYVAGADEHMRQELNKQSLKKRVYVGPTSLDHNLSLLMSNLTYVRRGSLVLDPFVGTASILVAATYFGARCFGGDIDIRVLKGDMYAGHANRIEIINKKEISRDIFGNFSEYGMECPELVRLDNHLFDRHYSNAIDGFFDVIVTDPPYSIRAGARKSGKKGGCKHVVSDDKRSDHYPATQNYTVEEVMLDLLHTSARALTMGGRLAYLIPTPYDFVVSDLPEHPCLTIERTCRQMLTTRHGRHLVIAKKTKEYTAERHADFVRYSQQVMTASQKRNVDTLGFSGLLARLERALAGDARENPEVIKYTSRNTQSRYNNHLRKKEYAISLAKGEIENVDKI
jgi:tRNA (guanine10-N2)-methyltransferase